MDGVVDRVWREERAQIVATLARRFSDLELAEDAVQEAFAAAATAWPRSGTPERPGAWLTTTAYRKAIGMLRKRRPTDRLDDLDAVLAAPPPSPAELENDLFGLIVACCHPSLAVDARIALTLRHVCGLNDQQIASALVVAPATLTKRLVRARRKIRDAAISFDPPALDAIADRIDDVHTVVYLVFTEGHLSASPDQTVRGDLCDEAIWLARQLRVLRPHDPETAGLLALMLVQNGRRDARIDPGGALVRFDEQDRTRWDQAAFDEARTILARTHPAPVGRYQVEATIALLHVTDDEPNWPRIADLYGILSRIAPSPVVEVNRALAVGQADGPLAGLAVIQPILREGTLARYADAHAAYASLLERTGRMAEAAEAWTAAAAATPNEARRALMLDRAATAQP